MDPVEQFKKEVSENIERMAQDSVVKDLSSQWMNATFPHRYSYNFSWMGRPIIQYPQDMVAMQEIIWRVRPDLIIETGVAHGGSLVYYASLLELIGQGRVLGIDIEIRPHNRVAIEAHPMARRIELIEGSSTDPEVIAQVGGKARACKTVLVCLDSNHSNDHVLAELRAYAPLVSVGSYCVVFDTVVADMPDAFFKDRPWGAADNPKTAVHRFLAESDAFTIDRETENKLLLSVCPDGYLKRVK